MNNADIFFSLLKSGIYARPIPQTEMPDNIDWKAVASMAKKHAVLGIIIDSIRFLPPHLRPDPDMTAKMDKFALGLISANLFIENTIARLVSFLAGHGISGVLLKGQGVARYYPSPQMRHSGDIDFYVGKSAYKEAADLCRRLLSDPASGTGHNEHHFNFTFHGVPVELHRLASTIYNPLRNHRFQRWVADQLERTPSARRSLRLADADVALPSYDFDAIFIFYHAWRHFIMGGIGLRQLCDWAMIFHTHHRDIDIPALTRNIRRFGLTKGWKLFAAIAVDHLGVSPEIIPLYDPAYRHRAARIFDEIMEGGNFGYYSKAVNRTPIRGSGIKHALGKLRNITGYFISLFPIIPLQATILYLNRLFYGTIVTLRRKKQK